MRNFSFLAAISLMIGAANHCQAQDITTVHANVGEMLIDMDIENWIFDPFNNPEWDPPITLFAEECGGAGRANRMVPPAGIAAPFNPIETFSFEAHLDAYEGLPINFDIGLAIAAIDAAEEEVARILDMRNIEFIPGSIKAQTWMGPYHAFLLNSEIESTSIVVIDEFTYDAPSSDYELVDEQQDAEDN